MEDDRKTVMGFSTGIFLSEISRLYMWKHDLYTESDPGSLKAPTLIIKNVPFKSDQTFAGKKKSHHNLEKPKFKLQEEDHLPEIFLSLEHHCPF